MALLSLVPSSPTYSEGSQIIETVNYLVGLLNAAFAGFSSTSGVVSINGSTIRFTGLATTDPAVLGEPYLNGTNLHVSAG